MISFWARGGYKRFLEQCLKEKLDILYTSPYHIREQDKEPRKRVFEDRLIEDGTLIKKIAGKLIDGKYLSTEEAPFLSTSVWNVLYRKQMLDDHGIAFKVFIDYEDDWIFNIETLIAANRIATSSSGYYCWVIHDTSESHRRKYIANLLEKRKRWMAWMLQTVKSMGVDAARIEDFVEHVLRPRNMMMCFNNACWKPGASRQEIIAEIEEAIGAQGWDISSISVAKTDEMDRINKLLLLLLKCGYVKAAYDLNTRILKKRFH